MIPPRGAVRSCFPAEFNAASHNGQAMMYLNGVRQDVSGDPGLAFTRGFGLYETTRSVDGLPLFLRRHLHRLAQGLQRLEWTIPFSSADLAEMVGTLAAEHPGPSRLRIIVHESNSNSNESRPDVLVTATPLAPWPQADRAVVAPWRRNEHSAVVGLKTTSWAENTVAWQWAQAQGAGEALMANTEGWLCEGTGSNVFVVRDGVIATPPLSSGCLPGVTRAVVCELAEVSEVDLPMSCLAEADEVFLTSATRDIHPLAMVNDRLLPAPGPVTGQVMERFQALVVESPDW